VKECKPLEQVFDKYDTDGSGVMDHAEFVRALLPSDFQRASAVGPGTGWGGAG
jgi:hypothetical protein